MFEDFWTNNSALVAVAALIGAFIGFVPRELWRRFRGRMVTLRWSVQHYRIAASGVDDRFGKVEVLYNGQSVGNVQGCILELENESSTDLTDVELNLAYADGTGILTGEGAIVGSNQLLPLAQKYVDVLRRVWALPEKQRQQAPDYHYCTQRRDFRIPVLNRGARAKFMFVVSSPSLASPALGVSCDHPGVRLRNRPLQVMWWGESQERATYIGFVEAALFAGVAGVTIVSPLWACLLGFVLGVVGIVFGTLSLKLNRFLRRIF